MRDSSQENPAGHYPRTPCFGSSSPSKAPATSLAMLLSLDVSFAWGCESAAQHLPFELRSFTDPAPARAWACGQPNPFN